MVDTRYIISSVVFSPDGSRILIMPGIERGCCFDAILMDWRTQDIISTVPVSGYSFTFGFLADNRLIFGIYGPIGRGETPGAKRILHISNNITALEISGDVALHPELPVYATADDVITIIEDTSDRLLQTLSDPILLASRSGTSHIEFSSKGNLLYAWNNEASDVVIWEVAEGEVKQRLPKTSQVMAFSPDETRFALANDRSITIWNLETGEQELVLVGHESEVTALGFDSAGTILVSGTAQGDVMAWNTRTGEILQVIQEEPANSFTVFDVIFNQDSSLIAFTNWPDHAHIMGIR
jgi:WD40 repeat protein